MTGKDSAEAREGDAENGNAAESKLEHAERLETSEMVRERWSSIEAARERAEGVETADPDFSTSSKDDGFAAVFAAVLGFASARRDATFAEVNATSVTRLSAGRWLSRCATRSAKKVTSSSRNNSRRLAVWSTARREVARSGGLVSSRSTSPRVSSRRHHASPLSRKSRGSPPEETVLLPGLTQSEGSVASPSAAVTGLQLAEARDGESAKRGVDGANASEERDIRDRRSR